MHVRGRLPVDTSDDLGKVAAPLPRWAGDVTRRVVYERQHFGLAEKALADSRSTRIVLAWTRRNTKPAVDDLVGAENPSTSSHQEVLVDDATESVGPCNMPEVSSRV